MYRIEQSQKLSLQSKYLSAEPQVFDMSAGKRPRNRRRWSPPQHPDPKQKEFTPPVRREDDVARSQVKGWLKLAESALMPQNSEVQSYDAQSGSDEIQSPSSGSKDRKPDAA